MKLENWSFVIADTDPYRAPETKSKHLVGNIYGSAKFEDGVHVKTSAITSVDFEKETVTTKSGSVYELGKVDTLYEEMFPDAREKLFEKSVD